MTQLVKIDIQPDYGILHFQDMKNLDANNAARVKAEAKGLITEAVKNLLIDLTKVQFIDSTGFGSLISILKDMKSKNGRLILFGISSEVKELMDLMQLLSVFESAETLQDAISKINP